MPKITKLKTDSSTLFPPGAGLKKLMAPRQAMLDRHAAEKALLAAKTRGDEGAITSAKAALDDARLKEKHLREKGRGAF
jgi:hypothetical protein